MNNPTVIDFAIWGLLPEKYHGDWSVFQEYTNSLTVEYDGINDNFFNVWYTHYTRNKRCIITVTGFYISNIKNENITTYYGTLPNNTPLGLAGIYNEIEDGYITCAIITTQTKTDYAKKQNLGKYLPVVIKKSQIEKWLDPKTTINELDNMLMISSDCELNISV